MTLNADSYYIKTQNEEMIEELGLTSVISFETAEIDGDKLRATIYPSDNDKLIVNTNLADRYGLTSGDHITIIYSILGLEERIDLLIDEVYEEKDTSLLNIYYPKGDVEKILEEKKLPSGQPVLNYLQNEEALYQYDDDYNDHDRIVQMVKRYDEEADVIHPLYDEREAIRRESRIYSLLFTIAILIIALAIFIYDIIFNDREAKRFKRTAALIRSFDAKGKTLNSIYIGIRSKIIVTFTLLLIFSLIGAYLLSLVDLVEVLLIVCLIIATLIISLYTIKKATDKKISINQTLKD